MIGAMTLISRTDRTVPVTVQARTPVAPGSAFDIVVPIDLSRVFHGWGPFPGVRGAKNQTGAWDHVGASRNPDLSDGSTATERLTEYTSGHSFGYEITGFTNMLGKIAEGVRGEWTFTPDQQGTVIRWTYEFKPRPGCHPVIAFGLAPVWRRYMLDAIRATVSAVEQDAHPD
jgi:hypothetical protein